MCTSSKAPSPPPPAPQAPTPAPGTSGTIGESFQKAAQKRRGSTVGGTLLTGPQGLTTAATTQQKTLLGG